MIVLIRLFVADTRWTFCILILYKNVLQIIDRWRLSNRSNLTQDNFDYYPPQRGQYTHYRNLQSLANAFSLHSNVITFHYEKENFSYNHRQSNGSTLIFTVHYTAVKSVEESHSSPARER